MLKNILLIDDDKDCNFLQKRTLLRSNCTESVEVATNGATALELLGNGKFNPELIFLDINMPNMDGWEFLNELKKVKNSLNNKVVVIMLTSSLNPDDRRHAEEYEMVSGFESKYLEEANLKKILAQHFPSKFAF